MYTLTVSDHIMIAHSLRGEVFGPAQKLHGATYAVEAEFHSAELDRNGLVCDIGLALQLLKNVLSEFNFKNLDEVPDLQAYNTTTEFMAGEIFARIKGLVKQGELGPESTKHLKHLKIVLRESPVAWASFEGSLA